MMKPVLGLAALCLLLGACQTTQPTPTIQTFAAVPVPTPAPVKMRDVEFKVYNVEDLHKLSAKLKASGDKKFVIIALTPKGYQNLALNLNELERYIREQKRVTIYLKEVIDGRAKAGKPSQ